MRVLPVIDLQAGQVVRAIAGERHRYRAISSLLVAESSPSAVAGAWVAHFQFAATYVADLDAIAGAAPDWVALRAIASSGLDIILDAGMSDAQRAREFAACELDGERLAGIVMGLESTPDPRQLTEWLAVLGPARSIFSLDLKHGQPLTDSAAWRGFDPPAIARIAIDAGFRRLIVLDLANVGTSGGPSVAPLCRELHERYPQLELIAGGGVRDLADLRQLQTSGCHAALVASALHDGRVTSADVQQVATWSAS